MTRKRIARALAVLLVVLLGALGFVASGFVGLRPAVDGTDLLGGGRLLVDGVANLYVLPASPTDVVLIDCGADTAGARIDAELAAQGLTRAAVKAIFLTHGHRDHTGACHNFPAATVYAMPGDVGLIEGTEAAHGPIPRLLGRATAQAVHVGHPLTDGEIVRVGALVVRAYAIPGHTAGSAAFDVSTGERPGAVFFGDALAANADGTLRTAPWVFSDDTTLNRQSVAGLAARLAGAPIVGLAFGHSGPVEGDEVPRALASLASLPPQTAAVLTLPP